MRTKGYSETLFGRKTWFPRINSKNQAERQGSERAAINAPIQGSAADIIRRADDAPVAVLNHNRPEAYLLPAGHYERLMAYMEDLEDAKLVRERADGPFVDVSIDDL